MPIYDITLPISESLLVWPGVQPVKATPVKQLSKGDIANESHLAMHVHNGTHVDAPSHFFQEGVTVDALDLDVLVGPALVVVAMDVDILSAVVLEALSIPPDTERILFRTRNSDRWACGEREFTKDYVAITEDGARWLVGCGVRLVGVDYLSVAPYAAQAATHQTLLRAGVIVIESLDLSGIDSGEYQLVCLPLKIEGAEGAPARVILIEESER